MESPISAEVPLALYPRAPSASIVPTLGPKVYEYNLLWAIWSPRYGGMVPQNSGVVHELCLSKWSPDGGRKQIGCPVSGMPIRPCNTDHSIFESVVLGLSDFWKLPDWTFARAGRGSVQWSSDPRIPKCQPPTPAFQTSALDELRSKLWRIGPHQKCGQGIPYRGCTMGRPRVLMKYPCLTAAHMKLMQLSP